MQTRQCIMYKMIERTARQMLHGLFTDFTNPQNEYQALCASPQVQESSPPLPSPQPQIPSEAVFRPNLARPATPSRPSSVCAPKARQRTACPRPQAPSPRTATASACRSPRRCPGPGCAARASRPPLDPRAGSPAATCSPGRGSIRG